MNQELLNELLQKATSALGGGDLGSARKMNLITKIMEVVERATNLPGTEKKRYAMELVKLVYNKFGVSNIKFEGEELGETIDLLVSVGKGVYEIQKRSSVWIKILKKLCKK